MTGSSAAHFWQFRATSARSTRVIRPFHAITSDPREQRTTCRVFPVTRNTETSDGAFERGNRRAAQWQPVASCWGMPGKPGPREFTDTCANANVLAGGLRGRGNGGSARGGSTTPSGQSDRGYDPLCSFHHRHTRGDVKPERHLDRHHRRRCHRLRRRGVGPVGRRCVDRQAQAPAQIIHFGCTLPYSPRTAEIAKQNGVRIGQYVRISSMKCRPGPARRPTLPPRDVPSGRGTDAGRGDLHRGIGRP